MPFKLSWRKGGAPGNDAFDAAIALEGGEGQVKGTKRRRDAGVRRAVRAAGGDGLVRVGGTRRRLVRVRLERRAPESLRVRDAPTVGELRLVSGFPEEQIRFPAKAGDAYRVAVASRDSESAGTDFVLSWAALVEHESSNDLLENAGEFADAESSSRSVDARWSETVEFIAD